MILDDYPELRRLDQTKKAQLVSELMDDLLAAEITLPPELLAALEERVAFNNAHPEQTVSMNEVGVRLRELKAKIAARRVNG